MSLPSAVTLAASNATGVVGQMGRRHGYDGRGFDDGFDGRRGGPLMLVILLLLVAAAAFGVAVLLRRRKGLAPFVAPVVAGAGLSPSSGPGASGVDIAAAILRERFARGDINEVEYLHRKAVLEGRANVPANAPMTNPSADTTATADGPPEQTA